MLRHRKNQTTKTSTLGIQVPSQKVIGDYLSRLGGSNYLLRRYVDPYRDRWFPFLVNCYGVWFESREEAGPLLLG